MSKENKNYNFRPVLYFGIFLFLIISYSLFKQTLVPHFLHKEYAELIYNALGAPIAVLGISIFGYGGWLFLIDTIAIFYNSPNNKVLNNIAIIRNKNNHLSDIKSARIENTKILLNTWRRGGCYYL